ncbi:MAG: prepilin-type N-terminal cleavage/methylation domain-containing protein [Lachnospiraceae bacterium]|nr:prepilin-type N-terminal cleavage/methylation domain-containing protein [Lachnospiraceae bacterium]
MNVRSKKVKRYKNQGFSLVELIIVIAIMAILVGILAPMYLKYVERSRSVADEEFADNVRKTCETLVSDPDENLEIGSYVVTITPNSDITITADNVAGKTHVDNYLKQVVGSDYAKTRIRCKSYTKIEVSFSNTIMPSCTITYTN